MKRNTEPTNEEIVEIIRGIGKKDGFVASPNLKPRELPQDWKDQINKEFPDLTAEWESR